MSGIERPLETIADITDHFERYEPFKDEAPQRTLGRLSWQHTIQAANLTIFLHELGVSAEHAPHIINFVGESLADDWHFTRIGLSSFSSVDEVVRDKQWLNETEFKPPSSQLIIPGLEGSHACPLGDEHGTHMTDYPNSLMDISVHHPLSRVFGEIFDSLDKNFKRDVDDNNTDRNDAIARREEMGHTNSNAEFLANAEQFFAGVPAFGDQEEKLAEEISQLGPEELLRILHIIKAAGWGTEKLIETDDEPT